MRGVRGEKEYRCVGYVRKPLAYRKVTSPTPNDDLRLCIPAASFTDPVAVFPAIPSPA